MNDLTEQWRKGELLEDFYYVRCAWSDEVEIRYVHNGVDDWKEVVAEVPDYEEWQAKLEENAQLKELLKECLTHLTIGKYGTSVTPINILCDEVEEALK